MLAGTGDRSIGTVTNFTNVSAQTPDPDVLSGDLITRLRQAEGDGRSMRVILDVLEGPRKGRSFVFDRHDTFIVGRSRFVHCSMPEDAALSRDHFMVEVNPPLCELRDLGSTNGTFVNNDRVERIRLVSGDMIAAGQSVFHVHFHIIPRKAGNVLAPHARGMVEAKFLEPIAAKIRSVL